MEFTLGLESPFNLDYTLESGQVFRWENRGEWWYGVVGGGVLRAKQEGDVLKCASSSDLIDSRFVRNYFRLDEDLQAVEASILKDDSVRQAVQRFYGLRLIRQDRWECLASFVLATNANIPRIGKMIAEVCSRYGDQLEFEGAEYHAFPKPGPLAQSTIAELRKCGLGYRAPFLKAVAESVTDEKVDFDELDRMGYEDAHKTLLQELPGEKLLPGVGPKVADCVLLYSFGKDEAFPIDVWIARAIAKSYPYLLDRDLRRRFRPDSKTKVSLKDYSKVSKSLRAYFGPYAGYAQQYLFMASRAND